MDKKPDEHEEEEFNRIEGDRVKGDKSNISFDQQINISGASSGTIRIEGDAVYGDKVGGDKIFGDKVFGDVIPGGGTVIGQGAQVNINTINYGSQSSNLPKLQERLFGMADLRVDLFDAVTEALGKVPLRIAITGKAGSGKTAVAAELVRKMKVWEGANLGMLWAALGPLQNPRHILRQWVIDTDVLGADRLNQSLEEYRADLKRNTGSRSLIVFFDNAQSRAEVEELQFGFEDTIYIMTTRDAELAREWADIVFETTPLTPGNCVKLIQNHYALDDELGVDEIANMESVAARTDGNPLTLRVIGQFLAGQTARTNPLGINIFIEQLGDDEMITLETAVKTILNNAGEFAESLVALGAFAADPADFELQAIDKICDVSARRLLRREFFGLARFENSKMILDKAVSTSLRNLMQDAQPFIQARHSNYYLTEVLYSGHDPGYFLEFYDQVVWAWWQTDDLVLLSQLIEAAEPLQREHGLEDDHIAWLERFVCLAEEKQSVEYLSIGLIMLGDAYVNVQKFEEAIGRYQRVIAELPDQVDVQLGAETLYKIGETYSRLGRLDRSLSYFTEALAILQESGADPALEAATSNDVGLIYDQLGKTAESLQHFHKALELLRVIDDDKAIAITLHNIAAALDNQGRSEEALEYYKEALAVRRQFSDMPGIANTLNNMGVLYRGRGQYKRALRNYAEALSIRESIGDRAGTAVILHNMGLAYQESGNYERALSQFEQAERIMRAVGDRAGLAATLDKMGLTFTRVDQIDQAREVYEESLEIKRQLNDAIGQAATHRFLGDTLVILGELDRAETQYDKAIELAIATDAHKQLGRALEQKAQLFVLMGEKEIAASLNEQALDAMRAAEHLGAQIRLHIVLGDGYAALKQFDEAKAHYEDALRITIQTEEWETEVTVLEKLAAASQEDGDIDRTLDLYAQIIDICSTKNQDPLKCAETYSAMGAIARQNGRLPEAVTFWQRSRDLYIKANNPAAKGVESQLDELQAAHSDLFDFKDLVVRFFEAAGFELEDNDDWAVLKPKHRTWRQFNLSARIPCRLLLNEELNADRVNRIYKMSAEAEPACRQIFVVIDKRPTEDGWSAISTLKLRAEPVWVMPITRTVIYEGQANRDQRLVLREQIDQMLGHHNLYEVRTPISDPLKFFGREAFANHLIEQLDEGYPVVLYGLRKMGKSSLLFYLRDSERLPYPTAYVDAQASTDAYSLFDRALDKWQKSLRVKAQTVNWDRPALDRDNLQASFTAAVRGLLEVLEEQGTHDQLCLMVDELELIHPTNQLSDIQNYLTIARTIRGLVQEQGRRFSLVGAAVDPFFNRSSRTNGLQNPLFKFFKEEYLQPIEQADCVQMIRSIGRQMGIEYEPGAAELIAEVSGGHPLIARQLAGLIHEQNDAREQITIAHAMDGTEQFLRDNQRVDIVGKNGLWAEVSDTAIWSEEQAALNVAMLSSLAEAQPQPYEQLRGGSSIDTTDYSLYELSQRAVLSKEAQREYAIRLQLFRRWIRRNVLEIQE